MVEIRICIGTSCHLNGAHNVIATFQHLIEHHQLHGQVHLEAAFCMRKCGKTGVSASVNEVMYRIEADQARKFFKEHVLPLAAGQEGAHVPPKMAEAGGAHVPPKMAPSAVGEQEGSR